MQRSSYFLLSHYYLIRSQYYISFIFLFSFFIHLSLFFFLQPFFSLSVTLPTSLDFSICFTFSFPRHLRYLGAVQRVTYNVRTHPLSVLSPIITAHLKKPISFNPGPRIHPHFLLLCFLSLWTSAFIAWPVRRHWCCKRLYIKTRRPT